MSHIMDIISPLTTSDIPTTTPFHFIGIGGSGMNVIAHMLVDRGYQVTGSDRQESPALDALKDRGVQCFIGQDASHVPDNAIVVASSAIPVDNPEIAIARRRGQQIIHRSQALVIAAHGARFVAVAGAHGKTTTSAMIAQGLRSAGLDPSFAVGGVVKGYGSGAHIGADDICIAEADESDKSFLNYRCDIAVITNIEPDHLDFYGSKEAFEEAFYEFASRVHHDVVICLDDEGARSLAKRLHGKRLITYGRSEGLSDHPDYTHYRICDEVAHEQGTDYVINDGTTSVSVRVPLPGAHNVLNATAAWIVGCLLGVEPHTMAEALQHFEGTGRRFEHRGCVNGIDVYDDYAHHPTEVAALMAQARQAHSTGRIIALFQPHLYSRTKNFADRFADALSQADIGVVCDIYGAREDPMPGVSSKLITQAMDNGRYIGNMYDAGEYIATIARPGDMIITIGAGDITTIADTICDRLGH